jgi:hypothetical protein
VRRTRPLPCRCSRPRPLHDPDRRQPVVRQRSEPRQPSVSLPDPPLRLPHPPPPIPPRMTRRIRRTMRHQRRPRHTKLRPSTPELRTRGQLPAVHRTTSSRRTRRRRAHEQKQERCDDR